MERKLFLRAFVHGITSLSEGMTSVFSWRFYQRQPFSYDERFGTDTERLASDWQRVGDDIRSATKQFEKEMKSNHK